jgi:hypothetical protein
MVKWELDLWYELWDRAGSQGLDTWYDPRVTGEEEHAPSPEAGDAAGKPEAT